MKTPPLLLLLTIGTICACSSSGDADGSGAAASGGGAGSAGSGGAGGTGGSSGQGGAAGMPSSLACDKWVQVGGELNMDMANNASYPRLAFANQTPYVTWYEGPNGDVQRVYVKSFDGDAWVQVGSDLGRTADQTAGSPTIAFDNQTPYVSWYEFDGSYQVYASRFDDGAWEPLGGSLNNHPSAFAMYPVVSVAEGVPYVVWQEVDDVQQIYAKRFQGGAWEALGGSLNISGANGAAAPGMAIANGTTPYVAWYELAGDTPQIHVKHFDGTAWVQDGSSLNSDPTVTALNPDIAVDGATPYVTWIEDPGPNIEIRVSRFVQGSWQPVGGGLKVNTGFDAGSPQIALEQGVPVVAWYELSGTPTTHLTYVKYFDGSDWVQLGDVVNDDPSETAGCSDLVFDQGSAYVAMTRWNGSAEIALVKRCDTSP